MKHRTLTPNKDSWKVGDQYRCGPKGKWLTIKTTVELETMPSGRIDPIWKGDGRRPSKSKVVSKTVRQKAPVQQANNAIALRDQIANVICNNWHDESSEELANRVIAVLAQQQ